MCRITGFISPTHNQSDLLRMRDSMHRGGPDDTGIYHNPANHVFLGHRRLALIDLTPAGHQPMSDPTGRLQIVYNGEIYNFKEIKSELISLGKSFHTQSDTEVILQSYLQWGTNCFDRFNGMFALALYDKLENKLILARDHAGIKPLYYSIQGESLFFASEVKAFKSLLPSWKERADWKIYFLAFGHLPEPVTTLEGVQHLPKGSYLLYDLNKNKYSIVKYYHPLHQKISGNAQNILDQVHNTLDQAVQRHLISDAPIGLFLSGGIDSSILALLAKKYCGDQLKTISIYFDEEKYSEKKYQDIIIKKTGAQHQSFLVTKSEFEAFLPDALAAMDQPTTDGINSYFISKYAHEYGLKAVLSGIGADELFGGYPSVQQASKVNLLKLLPGFILSLAQYSSRFKFRKIYMLSHKSTTGDFLFNRGLFIDKRIAKILELSDKVVRETLVQSLPPVPNTMQSKEKAVYMDYHYYMQNQLLRDSDFMSMWHGLEIRTPFLDKNLIALADTVPYSILFDTSKPKFALTQAFNDELPESIWKRPKQGFTFPFADWLKTNEIASPANNREKALFNEYLQGNSSWARYWAVKVCSLF